MSVEVFKTKHKPPQKRSRPGPITRDQAREWCTTYRQKHNLPTGDKVALGMLGGWAAVLILSFISGICTSNVNQNSPIYCFIVSPGVWILPTIASVLLFAWHTYQFYQYTKKEEEIEMLFKEACDIEDLGFEHKYQEKLRTYRQLVAEEFNQFCAQHQVEYTITTTANSDNLCLKYTHIGDNGARHVFRMTV